MEITITPADLDATDVARLVEAHAAFCDDTAPPGSCHRLTLDGLRAPGITMWTARDAGSALLGMVGLGALGPLGGEVKSMHTTAAARGAGVAKRLMQTLTEEASARAYPALWLETGIHPDFDAARRLYWSLGFRPCPPFGSYQHDPHSVFLTRALTEG